MTELIDKINEVRNISKILREDEIKCLNHTSKSNEQFWRRMHFRSFFAHVEGVTYEMKQLGKLTSEKLNLLKLSAEEIAIINEKSYDLTNSGTIKSKPQFQSIDKNIRFAINILLKSYEEKLELNLDTDNRWKCFKSSIKVRNRITHPKGEEDLIVTDKEIQELFQACIWFAEVLENTFVKITNSKALKLLTI